MIQIEHLSVAYQQTLALEDLFLTIQGPTILGIPWPQWGWKINPNQGHARTSPSCGKVQLDQKISAKFFNGWPTVEQKSAIDFHFPITVRECISLVFIPTFLSSREKQRRSPKVENALKLVNLLDPSGSPDRPAFRRAIPTVLIARCLVQEAGCHFWMSPSQGLTLSAKTSSYRPSRP